MAERTTVRLPEDLVRRAKDKAATEGRSLTALIEEGLRLVTDAPRDLSRAARTLPPVSAADGGLTPGMTIEDSSGLQELDDMAYIRRLG